MNIYAENRPKLLYLNETKFREAMLKLRQRGGVHGRAYDAACELIGEFSCGTEDSRKLTHWGESRIEYCNKYDLTHGSHRLVTLHTQGCIYLLYVGTHAEVDRWLDANKGLTVAANKESKRIGMTYVTSPGEKVYRESSGRSCAAWTDDNIPYLKRLKKFDVHKYIFDELLVTKLEALNENSTEEDILNIIGQVAEADPSISYLLLDVFLELRDGRKEGALTRIEQYQGKAIDVTVDPGLEAEAVKSSVNSDRLMILSGMDSEGIRNLFVPEHFQEWMLFPHPEQKRIAEQDCDKPVVLTGVSGSGKTCVLVHRAKYLAKKYPGESILLLTLNRSLCRLLQNLVAALCDSEEMKTIKVLAFYDYFEQLVCHFGPSDYLKQLRQLAADHPQSKEIQATIDRVDPSTFAREFDPLSNETLEDTWEVFLEQAYVKTLLTYLTEWVRVYDRQVDVEEYLREEFSFVRSATITTRRKEEYMHLKRAGRAIRFDGKTRQYVLDLLLLYEETMLAGGMLDELSLTPALLPHLSKLQNLPPQLGFRCLLVDEFQDLSTRDLALLRRIAGHKENSFIVAGDTVQRILVKDLRMKAVGLDLVNSKWEKIRKNYRNSKQILKAASQLANIYAKHAKQQGEEIEILDPELAERETAKPLAIKVKDGNAIEAAYNLARECLGDGEAVPWTICIATAAPDVMSIARILSQKPVDFPAPVEALTGDYNRNRDTMTVGGISDVKGFEFSMIIIVGCGASQLPPRDGCSEEAWRHALRLYVAMTRGRDQVALLYEGEPSQFMNVMREELSWEDMTTIPE
ncbi:MAG: UvrD-helicase domain-containing protein [bacterium]